MPHPATLKDYDAYTPSLLIARQPNRLKIACATVSHRLHPISISFLASAWLSNDHVRIQAVALYMTCKKWLSFFPLKIISFLVFYIAQNKALIPMRI